ncbi:GNAT family N-acetyltransferase [Cohnella sp. CFH 77786]|uniref:GNAT family N-acetyltransferase n=1 Tax=Cohnella sp. CFH 77786 TaxID=2662265 RepID=UPI001C60C133|nr:GNAT family N-acetyltransferase [Cohnella sp. CFH 77786]MBW5449467.1 GNAT family N-acetyltransferase [Cohnella sp. CFH 77786]
MLDKTLPYYNIIMKRRAGLPFSQPELPEGYSFTLYSAGMERNWAEIETSVGEFNDKKEALEYFRKEYLAHSEELQKRLIVIESPDGHYIATITAWWNYTNGRRDPSLHWLSVKPEFQGLGLGKALVYKCLQIFDQIEGKKDVYLHTQTWSYKAVGLYLSTGFELLKTESFGHYINEYEKAETIIRDRIKAF